MNRRWLITGAIASVVALASARGLFAGNKSAAKGDFPAISNSPDEWLKLLGEERYAVLFEEGTERPGSSALNDEKRDGNYICAACNLPLFLSDTKFDSGTGWPSFFKPIDGNIGTRQDFKILIPRTEYHCIRCGGHQGHVFNDGPPPTGERWCNNGLALRFVPRGETLPELRV